MSTTMRVTMKMATANIEQGMRAMMVTIVFAVIGEVA